MRFISKCTVIILLFLGALGNMEAQQIKYGDVIRLKHPATGNRYLGLVTNKTVPSANNRFLVGTYADKSNKAMNFNLVVDGGTFGTVVNNNVSGVRLLFEGTNLYLHLSGASCISGASGQLEVSAASDGGILGSRALWTLTNTVLGGITLVNSTGSSNYKMHSHNYQASMIAALSVNNIYEVTAWRYSDGGDNWVVEMAIPVQFVDFVDKVNAAQDITGITGLKNILDKNINIAKNVINYRDVVAAVITKVDNLLLKFDYTESTLNDLLKVAQLFAPVGFSFEGNDPVVKDARSFIAFSGAIAGAKTIVDLKYVLLKEEYRRISGRLRDKGGVADRFILLLGTANTEQELLECVDSVQGFLSIDIRNDQRVKDAHAILKFTSEVNQAERNVPRLIEVLSKPEYKNKTALLKDKGGVAIKVAGFITEKDNSATINNDIDKLNDLSLLCAAAQPFADFSASKKTIDDRIATLKFPETLRGTTDIAGLKKVFDDHKDIATLIRGGDTAAMVTNEVNRTFERLLLNFDYTESTLNDLLKVAKSFVPEGTDLTSWSMVKDARSFFAFPGAIAGAKTIVDLKVVLSKEEYQRLRGRLRDKGGVADRFILLLGTANTEQELLECVDSVQGFLSIDIRNDQRVKDAHAILKFTSEVNQAERNVPRLIEVLSKPEYKNKTALLKDKGGVAIKVAGFITEKDNSATINNDIDKLNDLSLLCAAAQPFADFSASKKTIDDRIATLKFPETLRGTTDIAGLKKVFDDHKDIATLIRGGDTAAMVTNEVNRTFERLLLNFDYTESTLNDLLKVAKSFVPEGTDLTSWSMVKDARSFFAFPGAIAGAKTIVDLKVVLSKEEYQRLRGRLRDKGGVADRFILLLGTANTEQELLECEDSMRDFLSIDILINDQRVKDAHAILKFTSEFKKKVEATLDVSALQKILNDPVNTKKATSLKDKGGVIYRIKYFLKPYGIGD